MTAGDTADLAGLRVLVVEDEPLIAMLLEDMLLDLGCQAVGPFGDLAGARAATQNDDFDVALVDLLLAGERADSVAQELSSRKRPFAIASGGPTGLGLGEAAQLAKPYTIADLATVLTTLRNSMSEGV